MLKCHCNQNNQICTISKTKATTGNLLLLITYEFWVTDDTLGGTVVLSTVVWKSTTTKNI